ncbi:MAG: glycosyltransferase [Terracidiphilus sp.]|jgi:glycosyltransferase involved in cell wall biosynthesis
MTKISIAMATYNGERFIRQQLDSFVRQTLLPSELIICDDGSTDSTVSIINNFVVLAPFPVVIVHNSVQLGYTANFLQAAQKCQGDLIAFSDQDDEWLPHKLARILQASRESDAFLLAHAAEWVDEDGNPVGVVYPAHRRFRKYLRKRDFPGHAIVIRKSLLEMTLRSLAPDHYKEVAGDVEFGHDVLLLEIATAMDKVLYIPEVLMRWRVYSDTNHAWTRILKSPPHARTSLLKRIFPPDLAEKYRASEAYYRKHSVLLAGMLRDLETFGGDAALASGRLVRLMNLMTKRADVMELRARYYGPLSRKARIKLMLQGAAMGQYRNAAKGGVGIHNAIRDILACLVN